MTTATVTDYAAYRTAAAPAAAKTHIWDGTGEVVVVEGKTGQKNK